MAPSSFYENCPIGSVGNSALTGGNDSAGWGIMRQAYVLKACSVAPILQNHDGNPLYCGNFFPSEYDMAEYSSGSIHFSGLMGGTNFDSTIEKLYAIQSKPIQQLARWKADWQTRQDAFKSVRTELTNLRTALTAINTVDKFLTKSSEASRPEVATATAESSADEGVYRVEVDQLATSASWSRGTTINDKNAAINTTAGTFAYSYKGEQRTITIPVGTSLEGLQKLINEDSKNRGVKASLVKGGDGYVFQLRGKDTGADANLSIDGITNLPGLELDPSWNFSSTNAATINKTYNGPSSVVNSSGADQDFSYKVRNAAGQVNTYSVTLHDGATLQDFADAIEAAHSGTGAPPARASLVDTGVDSDGDGENDVQLKIFTDTATDQLSVHNNANIDGFANRATSDWQKQANQNAKLRVNNWPNSPQWLESATNSVKEVIENVTFNLKDEGVSVITLAVDKEAVMKNAQTFVDAMNKFRSVINDLSKFSTDKKTVDSDFANSQFEMQKGSVLTGNYGVQLVASRLKSAVASQAKGFNYYEAVAGQVGNFTGDMFSALGQIGILTNGEQNSPMLGLLEINNEDGFKGSMAFETALSKDPRGVAMLFAASGAGATNSPNFSFESQISTITAAGSYDVEYNIDSTGNITSAKINGKDAKIDNDSGQLSLVREAPQSSQPNAVSATFDGTQSTSHNIEVSQIATKATATNDTYFTTLGDVINTDDDPHDITITVATPGGGTKTTTIAVPKDVTLQSFIKGINSKSGETGVTASAVAVDDDADPDTPAKYQLKFTSTTTGAKDITVDMSALPVAGACTSVAGVDAKYTVDGGPERTSSVNTITGISGLTEVTLKDVTTPGTPATITTAKHDPADGIMIRLDNRGEGTFTGKVNIKQGKINEVLEMLNGTSLRPEEGMLGSKGALRILENNYQSIMDNISDKMAKETTRLSNWERTTRLRFSRLETTLAKYSSLDASVKAQVKSLGGS